LLAFSRKRAVTPAAVSLNAAIEGMLPMLRRLITANIVIDTDLDAATPIVWADPTQLEQVLMNLIVNARDAMPRGGVVTIATRPAAAPCTPKDTTSNAAAPCAAELTVTDTGTGMTQAVQERIFEPFFTTKERGHGTGLGLAAVSGIVQQLGGTIRVSSEVGRGSVFAVQLPRTDRKVIAPQARSRGGSRVGSETVLLVEDEPAVRQFVRTVLTRHGYRIIEACSAEAALAATEHAGGDIDLLFTDIMLSGMDGAQLHARLRRDQPRLRALFMSAYLEPVGTDLPSDADLLRKPFTAQTLLARVEGALA
jgi:two-component system cell cycle sensor histidine kinase/response regulator CckA